MAKYVMERTEFIPHPIGPSEGIIYEIKDLGIIQTPFGDKHKVAIKIQSISHRMEEDNKPYVVQKLVNVSGHEAGHLYKFRCAALKKTALTDEEAYNFDDQELLNVRVGYVVTHSISSKNGNTYANLDTVWRLDDQSKGSVELELSATATQAAPAAGNGQPEKPNKDDLPF